MNLLSLMYACGSFWRTALEPLAHLPLTRKCREQKSQGFPSHSMKGWTLPFKITMKSDLSWLSFYPSFICILDKLHLLSCRILIICHFAAAAAKSLQSCPILCDPIDGSPPGSLIPGILQARILEWVAISFSNALKWKVKVKRLSPVRLLVTSWTVAYQASPSMGFSRQEYWSGLPLPFLISGLVPAKDSRKFTTTSI